MEGGSNPVLLIYKMNKKGFTLIELMLVIVGTAAMLFGLLLAVQTKTWKEKYTIPVISTQQYLPDVGYIKLFVLDGCEYFQAGEAVFHKGNCTNSIHNSNQ